jgi:hypothetical protein
MQFNGELVGGDAGESVFDATLYFMHQFTTILLAVQENVKILVLVSGGLF